MATNYRPFSGPAPERLHIDNLDVGGELIQADWDSSTGRWSETVWTIVKVLKSRLVLARDVKRGDAIVTDTLRVLVRNSKSWPYGNGEVEHRVEGQSEWSRDSYYFFTPDEPALHDLRASLAAANAKFQARANVRNAVAKITNSPRYFTAGDALEAIAALQAFIEVNKEED